MSARLDCRDPNERDVQSVGGDHGIDGLDRENGRTLLRRRRYDGTAEKRSALAGVDRVAPASG
jgi:hypothetical protein